ncbi:MAG: hypothetical protein HQL04_07030 [Nitrospirae bacterium]|nr:hypothetical protein [Nitrospirota bacterium]
MKKPYKGGYIVDLLGIILTGGVIVVGIIVFFIKLDGKVEKIKDMLTALIEKQKN